MATKRANHRAAWLKKEFALIKRLLRDGLSVLHISKKLGRTEAAVRKKAHDQGISTRRVAKKRASRKAS
jgi:hypothetical protein